MFSYEYFLWYYLVVWTITTLVTSIFVHRGHAHRLVECSPGLSHFCRFWLWSVGIHWPNWAQHWSAIHRKHHTHSDTGLDPHSPHIWSAKQLLDSRFNEPGKPYHITADEVKKWASDVTTYNDWIENNVYVKYYKGYYVFHAMNLLLFGPIGFLIGLILYIPLCKASLIHNYLSHRFGLHYEKNIQPGDKSVNIMPWGMIWAGEELAANHHNNPELVKYSKRWWEVDTAWGVIKILSYFKLIKILGKTTG